MIHPRQIPAPTMQAVAALLDIASEQPDGRLDIRDQTGAVVATLQVHQTRKRPKDMPRALRPKQKLSKRERLAAKRAKLAPAQQPLPQ